MLIFVLFYSRVKKYFLKPMTSHTHTHIINIYFGFRTHINYIYFYVILNGKTAVFTYRVDNTTVGLGIRLLLFKPALIIMNVTL